SAIRERGWEVVAHGWSATRMITSRLSAAEEGALIADSLDVIAEAFSRQPRGWLSTDFGESTRTPAMIAEAGFDYILDWANDDAPYWMTTRPPLLSIPNQVEWDDLAAFLVRRVPIRSYPDLI